MHEGFLTAGPVPTLFASFLHLDMSFMVWVLLGPLGVAVARTPHLDLAQKGLMVATPVLAGISSVSRRSRTSWGQICGAARV